MTNNDTPKYTPCVLGKSANQAHPLRYEAGGGYKMKALTDGCVAGNKIRAV